MNLLWKFRFYLTRDKKALTKFLKRLEGLTPNFLRTNIPIIATPMAHPETIKAVLAVCEIPVDC